MGCSNCTTCDASETKRCGTSSVFNWLYQIESTNENHKKLIEVQATAEKNAFEEKELNEMIRMVKKEINKIFKIQEKCILDEK